MKPRKLFTAITTVLCSAALTTPLWAQASRLTDAIDQASGDVTSIARAAGATLGGVVGFIGVGRTAYKLSNGDTDATESLIMAVVGIALGFASVMLL